MSSALAIRPSNRARQATVLAIVLFASYAYFYEGGGWNQNTRFDLVRAIIERHTLRIDAYHENTGDKAEAGGHYYADKAPGASLAAVPAVAVVRGAMYALRRDVDTTKAIVGFSYVATLAGAALPTVVAALAVFLIAGRLGAGDGAAMFAAVVCGLGTPLWPYATILYGHSLAGGCLVAALFGAVCIPAASTQRGQIALGLCVGLSAGWAVVTEYPASVAAALIVAFAAWQTGLADRARFLRLAIATATGLATAAIVLLVYNRIAFGSALRVAYSNESGSYDAMQTGIFGVTWPKLSVARELLFGAYRGLLPLAPVLIIVPAGFWILLRERKTRALGLIAAAVATYYFLLDAGYAYWSGGWSYGSRHVGPALPFLCLGIWPVWQRAGKWPRAAILVLACLSVGQSLVAVATTPQPPAEVTHPMRELLWPAFRSGDFPIGWQSVLDLRPPPEPMSQLERDGVPRESWNLGQLAGLAGHASLLPLLAIWLIGAGAWDFVRPARRLADPDHTSSAASAARAR